ncbi:hypothetical protein E4H12_04075 [Candidatus Thorarchaeota archaeon]|nr:MAG: hypothetical protein E4H12_04075 [Candidatus Thorarchaeota archaeon]
MGNSLPIDKPLLVTYNSNWADEMDIDGFYLTTQFRWDRFVERVNSHFKDKDDYTYYIGTNEEIVYESVEMLLSDFKVEEITAEEATLVLKLFGKGFGFTGPDVE